MKKFLFSLMLTIVTLFTISCKDNDSVVQDTVKKEWTSERQGDVVYVKNGNNSFFMDYLLYTSLMNRGGYNSVSNHYYLHSNELANQSNLKSKYTTYKTQNSNTKYNPITINNLSKTNGLKTVAATNNYVKPKVYTKPITTYKPSISTTKPTSSYQSTTYKSTYKPSYSSSSNYRSSSSSYRSSSSSYRSSSRR